jgi:signal transduction histidine kinase
MQKPIIDTQAKRENFTVVSTSALDSLKRMVEELQAKLQDAEREVDSLKDQIDEQNTWPDWANRILKMVRERSGNDGYDDMSEGVDLPDEVDEALSELAAQAERANSKVEELEKDAARYRWLRDDADVRKYGFDSNKGKAIAKAWNYITDDGFDNSPSSDQIDAAIDAAMSKE